MSDLYDEERERRLAQAADRTEYAWVAGSYHDVTELPDRDQL